MIRAALGLCLVLLLSSVAAAGEAPSPADVQRAEYRVRTAVQAWAYEQWWTLWDMGNATSQSQIPREEFASRMAKGYHRAAPGRQIEALQVSLTSPTYGTANVRLGIRSAFSPSEKVVHRIFGLQMEDGDWKITLHDFLSLTR